MRMLPALVLVLASGAALAQTAPTPVLTPPPEPAYMRPISPERLTRVEVEALARAALNHCEGLGSPVTVSIMDVDGSLRLTQTSDRAKIVGIDTAPRKNVAVLAFGKSSAELQQRLNTDLQFAELFSKDERFLFYPGGLPIYRGKVLVGAIAAGGGRANDEACARAGLLAVPVLSERAR